MSRQQRPVVYVDLDQCSHIASRLDASATEVVCFCGAMYNGPSPPGAKVHTAKSMIRNAADSLFFFVLGQDYAGGRLADGRKVVVISSDASWGNAVPVLSALGVSNVDMITTVRGAEDREGALAGLMCNPIERERELQRGRDRDRDRDRDRW